MVKLITKWAKVKSNGGLSGKTITDNYRTYKEAEKASKWYKGSKVKITIVGRKRGTSVKKSYGLFGNNPFAGY